MVDVIAIFDIGKTNKKVLLFDKDLRLVFQEEQCFPEIKDDDDFPCDDIEKIEKWIMKSMEEIIAGGSYNIKAVNFSTYGASVVYLDEKGKRITPVYNYLKPMPPSVLEGFYESWGGIEEFSRRTASPPSGMLNSGLQILWLKKNKPSVFSKVKSIAHFPQYLSYLFTGKLVAEYTYIGCHTSLWDFDRMDYHPCLRFIPKCKCSSQGSGSVNLGRIHFLPGIEGSNEPDEDLVAGKASRNINRLRIVVLRKYKRH
ncbi:MAG TPA: FGGY family carbohydrate kinase [Bacteroidales bacterium]|nr:FGGY family carbohydrate kinase [Bacteroidales bacterium]